MAFIRKIKKKNGIYLAEVESYRVDGKVKQRFIRYIGKEVEGESIKKEALEQLEVTSVRQYLDYKVVHQVAQKLGIPQLLGKDLHSVLLLVYTQIITCKSINALPDYVGHTTLKELLGIEKLVSSDLYESLDKLQQLDFEPIEKGILQHFNSLDDSEQDALVLDVTDTYFKGKKADWKARKGKDGKIQKLVQVALAVTKTHGFPILHKTYEGNINNIKIFEDLLSSIRLHNYKLIILDRGEDIFQPDNKIQLTKVTIFYQSFSYKNGYLIALYNPEKEVYQRTKAMENEEKYDKQKVKYLGYSLLYHTTDLETKQVIKQYFEKDIVEKAYRDIKSIIKLNPIRKHRINRVCAHVKICYLAYAILSYIQFKVKPLEMSATTALEELQGAYKVDLTLKEQNLNWSKIVTLKNKQIDILKAIGVVYKN